MSILENHHAASLFFLLEEDQCNILETLVGDDYNKVRKHMIDNILYTDMSKHFTFTNELKGLPAREDYDIAGKHKPDIMKALVHAADIGNPARPFELCKEWALKILSEFFA
mmetsp:Transcript_7727/g.7143  ORF Transcript_7727/g.7143 Transcript_7727/m.7143 type:complete len:111 (+) Transcript_7727:502-834(+)